MSSLHHGEPSDLSPQPSGYLGLILPGQIQLNKHQSVYWNSCIVPELSSSFLSDSLKADYAGMYFHALLPCLNTKNVAHSQPASHADDRVP